MKEKFSTVWAYISHQEVVIATIYSKIVELKPFNEDKLVHIAYQLHNLYSAYEDMFKEISFTFENNIERNSGFHKNLLIRMKIAIPGIRPNVLSEDSYLLLGELMGFRHVFRHAYNYNLTADKMEILRKKILDQKTTIDSDIKIFKQFLEEGFSTGHQ
jgi:hypothetical protein